MKLKAKHYVIFLVLATIFSIICGMFNLSKSQVSTTTAEEEPKKLEEIESNLVAEKEITQNDDWKTTINLPKYDENGKLITYKVDEKDVPEGYTKTVEKNTITNTINQYNYKVEYYYDGVKNEEATENLKAIYNNEISEYQDKILPGYRLDRVEGTPLKVSTDEDTNVIKVYYVLKNTKVTVKYIDSITGEVLEEEQIPGKVFDKYETNAKDIERYTLVEEPENKTGEMTEEETIVTYKYKFNSKITINYKDEVTGDILKLDTKEGLEGDTITTSSKEIENYTLVKSPDTEEYTLTKEPQTTEYLYRKNSNVTVKYLEKDTNEVLADEEIIQGYEGKDYETTKKEIDGFTFSTLEGEAKGQMSRDGDIIIYWYLQNTTLKVDYIDRATNEVLADEVKQGLVGDIINTSSKDIEGYTLIEKPDTEEYTLTKEPQTVKYLYAKNTFVTVNYIDKITNTNLSQDKIEGYEGKEYETNEKDIEGYTLVKVPENKSGIMERDGTNVTYEYLYNSKLQVEHIDKATGTVLELDTKEGVEGEKVTTSSKDITNYILVEKPDVEEFTFDKTIPVVKYYYSHISEGVIEKHIDIITNELLEPEIIHEGNEGDLYNIPSKTFTGYDLVESKLPANSQGTMQIAPIEVKYYYIYKSTVNIQYVDKYSQEVIENEVISGHETDEYKTTPKEITGYKLDESLLPENATGTYTKDTINVIYYLISSSQGVEVNYIDQTTGEKIADSENFAGYEGDVYKAESKEIEGYTLVGNSGNIQGTMTKDKITVEYYYLHNSKVTVNYIDKATDETIKQEEIQGLETKEYKTTPKEFDGYDLVEELYPENSEGIYPRDEEVVNYYYLYKSNVTANYINKNTGDILNQEVLEGHEGDTIQTKEKDFKYYKLIEKADVEEFTLTKEPKTVDYIYRQLEFNVKLEQSLQKVILNGKTQMVGSKNLKIELPRNNTENTLKLFYTIKITNNGELIGNTTIFDYIPDGFIALENDNPEWTILNGKAYREVTDLQIGETREYTIVLTNNTQDITGTIKNKVTAENSSNEAGFEETTLEDNVDNMDFVIGVATGLENYIHEILLAILSILIAVAGIIILYIKKEEKKKLK